MKISIERPRRTFSRIGAMGRRPASRARRSIERAAPDRAAGRESGSVTVQASLERRKQARALP